jgi:DNA adenine methylase
VHATIELRPFLKWAGGKRQLLTELRRFYPPTIKRYFEPFVGSGAVFFDLSAGGKLQAATATLSDQNVDLIGTYLRIRNDTEAVISALHRLAAGHRRGGPSFYYEIRDGRFNPGRDEWLRAGARLVDYPIELAAMMVYLNRTGYNGLFRLNRSGHFNVPAGRYANPAIVLEDRLRSAAGALRSARVSIRRASFERIVARAGAGDLVYLDPPYAPLSTTSSFQAYTADGFSSEDQYRLRDVIVAAARRGAAVILSNSTAPSVMSLYDQRDVHRAGLRCWRVPARRAINSRPERRGAVEELVVTNVKTQNP